MIPYSSTYPLHKLAHPFNQQTDTQSILFLFLDFLLLPRNRWKPEPFFSLTRMPWLRVDRFQDEKEIDA
jgi:hypothetical protein